MLSNHGRSCDIHLRVISLKMLKISILEMSLRITEDYNSQVPACQLMIIQHIHYRFPSADMDHHQLNIIPEYLRPHFLFKTIFQFNELNNCILGGLSSDVYDPSTHFTNNFLSEFISNENYLSSISHHPIATDFCTCRDSYAVVTCTKFCGNCWITV